MSGETFGLPSARVARALQTRLLAWYAENRRDLPWRRTADPYAILRLRDHAAADAGPAGLPRFVEWLEAWPDLESLAAAPLADVLRRWQGLGYNTRARRLQACAVAAVAAAAPGAAPSCRGRPTDCAGCRVGPYAARAVVVFAHNDDLAAVDANVRVLSHELGLPEDLGDRDLQAVADAVLPRGRLRDWHNAFMDYGSLVLTARSTGIASRSRQGTFEGSRRQKRARALRRLLEQGPQPLDELAAALGIEPGDATDVVDGLRRDGLVTLSGGTVGVA